MSTYQQHRLSWHGRLRAALSDYLALTKPRTLHLAVGVIPAILLAERGALRPMLMLNILIGTILMTAGANTLNCVADADIDKLMTRTAGRPLARATVSRHAALIFGLTLSAAAFVWLWQAANLLTGLVAEATIAFYVLVYTLLIKRRTAQNVVWGGAANGMPVLIGWSGITGAIGWQAALLWAIVFFWTPPHSWALAMLRRADYRSAGVPMLPAIASDRQVAGRILVYSWLTAITTVALALGTGWLYGLVAVLAAAWMVVLAHQLDARSRRGEAIEAPRLFQRANIYLAAVFCAVSVDSALALPTILR